MQQDDSMQIAHERLKGLDRERVIAVVEPILRAHSVDGVELLWKTDTKGWVLELTIERPDSRLPGQGVTVDLCSEISRDLSTALDVADVIPQKYRLEVGSPGLERALYTSRDYQRFSGQLCRLKMKANEGRGAQILEGTLQGLDDEGAVVLDTVQGVLNLELSAIDSGHLIFDWKVGQKKTGGKSKGPKHARRRK